jgi:hypothetical protein
MKAAKYDITIFLSKAAVTNMVGPRIIEVISTKLM